MINLEGVVSVNWQDVPAKEIFPGIRKRILMKTKNGFMAQILEIDAGASYGPSASPPRRRSSAGGPPRAAPASRASRGDRPFPTPRPPRDRSDSRRR